jgi:hypothetical protein
MITCANSGGRTAREDGDSGLRRVGPWPNGINMSSAWCITHEWRCRQEMVVVGGPGAHDKLLELRSQ